MWLGIATLDHNIENAARLVNNLEAREKQRHEVLMGMLNRVEQRLINAHVFDRPQYNSSVLDWETVQAIALQQLEANPPKES